MFSPQLLTTVSSELPFAQLMYFLINFINFYYSLIISMSRRYRKVTPKKEKLIRELKAGGLTLPQISEELKNIGINP